MKIKPESEISCHITLTSVTSGLFHTKYLLQARITKIVCIIGLEIGSGQILSPNFKIQDQFDLYIYMYKGSDG